MLIEQFPTHGAILGQLRNCTDVSIRTADSTLDIDEKLQVRAVVKRLESIFGAPSLSNLRDKLHAGLTKDEEYHVKSEWLKACGIQLSGETFVQKTEVDNYFDQGFLTVEGCFDYLVKDVFKDDKRLQLSNRVHHQRNPFTLLNILLSDSDQKVRFEAGRSLYFLNMAFTVMGAQIEASSQVEAFNTLLNDYLFNPQREPGGEKEQISPNPVHYLSYHDPGTFACQPWIRPIKNGERLDESMLSPDMRFQTFSMYSWYDRDGNKHYVQLEPREKDPKKIILKLLRDDSMIVESLEDMVGAKMVFETMEEAALFIDTLLRIPNSGINPLLSRFKSTAQTGEYRGRHTAASKDLNVVKFDLNYLGNTYAIQIFDLQGYIDTKVRDQVAWEDYEVRRMVTPDNGKRMSVAELIFPNTIYHANFKELGEFVLAAQRAARRHMFPEIPEDIRRKDRRVVLMSEEEHDIAIEHMAGDILESGQIPSYIIIAEDEPYRLYGSAVLLAQKLGLSPQIVLDRKRINRIPKNSKVLIFDDIYRNGKHIVEVERLLKGRLKKSDLSIGALIQDEKTAGQGALSGRSPRIFSGLIRDTERTRTVFDFEKNRRVDTPVVELLMIREGQNEGKVFGKGAIGKQGTVNLNDGLEILVKIGEDGRLMIPGGKILADESPQQTAGKLLDKYFQMKHTPGIGFLSNKTNTGRVPYFITRMEPYTDLNRQHTYKMRHYVAKIPVTSLTNHTSEEFKWVKLSKLKEGLRWAGQQELIDQLGKYLVA